METNTVWLCACIYLLGGAGSAWLRTYLHLRVEKTPLTSRDLHVIALWVILWPALWLLSVAKAMLEQDEPAPSRGKEKTGK